MKLLSQLISQIPASLTLAVNDRAKALQAAGKDVIALAGGDPDFKTADHIIEAAFEAMHHQRGTNYPAPMIGIVPALEAIAAKMARDNEVQIADPRHQIIITPGGKWALYLALSAITNPGDEVLLLEPYWVSYPAMVKLTGGTAVAISLDPDDNFRVTAAQLRQHLSPRTKAIMVNNPCNPSGRVLTPAEIEAICQVAIEADLYVIADEIYEKLVFDGRQHLSLAAQPGMAERTLTVNGLSKAYAMTGWRLGWLVANPDVIKVATRLNSQAVSCAATFTMHAAVAALNGPQEAIGLMRDAYQARRDFMVPALNEIEGVACNNIEGTFYLMVRFPHSRKNSLQLAEAMLEQALIAGTPGIAFGRSGEGHVRFSIATAMSDLERAVERLVKTASLIG
jgi:aspartate aminotransferase